MHGEHQLVRSLIMITIASLLLSLATDALDCILEQKLDEVMLCICRKLDVSLHTQPFAPLLVMENHSVQIGDIALLLALALYNFDLVWDP